MFLQSPSTSSCCHNYILYETQKINILQLTAKSCFIYGQITIDFKSNFLTCFKLFLFLMQYNTFSQ